MHKTKAELEQEKVPKKKSRFSYQKEFYSDYSFPGMLYGAIIRSSFSGSFISIQQDGLPEGYTVITADDIPGKKFIESPDGTNSVPIFCQEHISYQGEPLGVVVGPNEEKVLELSKNIAVIYKEMNIPGSKDFNKSTKISTKNPDEIMEITKELQISGLDEFNFQEISADNFSVVATRTVQSGPCFGRVKKGSPKGIDQALAACPHIIENKWTYKIDSNDFHEPSGAICFCSDENGETEIEIYAQSLWLSNMRQAVADVLAIKPENIKINKTRSTNSSSNAVWYNSVIAAQVAVASYRTKKIVKLVYSTSEQKKFMDTMQPIIITNRTGTDYDGKIQAMDIHIDVEAGFYNPFAQEIVDRLAIASYGCYLVPNLKITARAIATFESASSLKLQMLDSAAFFAIENQMNEISKKLNISPAEIRKINFSSPDILIPHMPFNFLQEHKNELMDKICNDTNFHRVYFSYKLNNEKKFDDIFALLEKDEDEKKEGKQKDFHKISFPQRGVGLSCGFEGTCYFGSQMYRDSDPSLEIIWESENSLTIHTPLNSKPSIEILKNKISSELGVSNANINVDSDFSISEEPLIPDVVNSNISVTMELIDRCCDALRKARSQKKKFPIIIERRITERKKKQWNNAKFEGRPFLTESFGIAVVDLEIDMETFTPHIRELSLLIDGGKICNKEAAENSIKLAVHKILLGMIDGESDKPDKINIDFVESEKGSAQIGEIPYQILPSAITQAISQIVGEPITEFPLQTDTIYKIMQRRNQIGREEIN
ncbi:MAG: xanthine dehydrogenase family protein [Treponema sp.]|nr:xanthine dehydrogenase family protein [Treponema sp.]